MSVRGERQCASFESLPPRRASPRSFRCASAQQATTGTLIGIVRDQEGSAIAGATITVTGPAGSRVVQSDAAGAYSFRFLPPGSYVIEAAMEGHATLRAARS